MSKVEFRRPTKEKDFFLYCSFCGKSKHEGVELIIGPLVSICEECVADASDIVNKKYERLLTNAVSKMMTDRRRKAKS